MSADIAKDIAKYINGGFTELRMIGDAGGQNNLYYNSMPDGPDDAVAVLRYEGRQPDETFSNPLHTRHPRIQITVRRKAGKSSDALNFADDILRFLTVVKDQEIEGTKYQRITPQGEPFEIGPDPKNRERAMVNFEVSYYDTV